MTGNTARKRIAATLLTGLIVAIFAWPATLAVAQVPDCVVSCPDDPLGDVKKDVGDKVDKADDAAEPFLSKETKVFVENVKGTLGLEDNGGGRKPPPRRKPDDDPRKKTGTGSGTDNDFVRGSDLRGALTAASDRTSPLMHRALDPDRGQAISTIGSFAPPENDAMSGLFDALGESLQTFTFPLALTLLVVAFLVIQGRVDSRDPKLALAPVSSEQDYLSFS